MEECLVFVKPDAVLRKCIGAAVLQEFLDNQDKFSIRAFKEIQVADQLARAHYAEHEGKSFFPWLIKSLCSAPVLAMIIEGKIDQIRDFLGATFVQKAAPDSIRGKYGIWGGVNCVHASDSKDNGQRELALWKSWVGLEKESGVIKRIEEYIQKNCQEKVNLTNTLKIREICKRLMENQTSGELILGDLIGLLKIECPQCDLDTVQKFAELIIENVLF